MNRLNFLKVIVAITLVVSLNSCKDDPIPEEYLRSGNSVALTGDGNLIIAGYNTGTGGYDANLILANSLTGDTIWSRSFSTLYVDAFYNAKKANKGGFIATGFSNRALGASPGTIVVITDNAGKLVQSAVYGGSSNSQGFYVLPHSNSDSGYLVTGWIQKTTRADRDIYLLKLNNDGSVKWEKSYGPAGKYSSDTTFDAAYSIAAAPGGGYYLTGSLKGYSSGGGKIFLMKVSSKGDSLWTKTYGYGIGFSVTTTQDGNVAIGGTSQATSNSEITILKTDTAGKIIWNKVYSQAGLEYGSTLIQTTDGGYAITGITNSKGFGNDDVYLIKTNQTGDMEWDNYFGGSNVDQGFGLVQNSNQEYFITGMSNSDGSYVFLNKTDYAGKQIWVKFIK